MGMAKSERGPYFFGVSITRVRDRAVLMMFEGASPAKSEAVQAQVALALRTQADVFLGSVK